MFTKQFLAKASTEDLQNIKTVLQRKVDLKLGSDYPINTILLQQVTDELEKRTAK